jgi:phosphohistidine swiveling domain-containing protein
MPDKTIQWLSRRTPDRSKSLLGPKATSLCTLLGVGMRVPPCFVVTTAAFRKQMETGGLGSQIASLLDRLADRTQQTLAAIREIITRVPFAQDQREQVAAAYERLDATVVAVRSSATAEDLPGHSFAGQYETILGVRSLDECIEAIKRCWASLWTERAYEYRKRNGIDHMQVEMAVIVQRQIEPDAAGVAFTLDPVTGSRSRIVIESCRGLGEALVSGKVQPDRILLRKKNLSLIRQNLAADSPSLDLKSARRLGRFVRRIERMLGSPQDIEWAIRDGVLWFLQARPITAIPQPKPWEDRQVWTNLNVGEILPDVMTPMTRSVVVPVFLPLFRSVFRLFGADLTKSSPVGFVAGRLYFHVNTGIAAAKPFSLGQDNWARASILMGGEQQRQFELGEFDLCEEDLPDLGFSWPRYVLSWPGLLGTLIAHRPSRGEAFMARIRAQGDALSRMDFRAMSTRDLASLVGRIVRESLGDADLLYLGPGLAALGVLQKACRTWLGDENLTLTYRLFVAQGGITDTQAGLDLWRLAAMLAKSEERKASVLAGANWDDLRPRLDQTEHGREFLAAWDRFMAEHGHHCRGEIELFNARWSERPDYVLDLVRGYLRSIDRTDPLANQERLAREREQLTTECRRRLKNPVKRAIFGWAIRNSRKVAVDRENWKNEFIRHMAAFRRGLLEFGERLRQQGVLKERDDVFFLEISEIEPAADGSTDFDVGRRIADRRAEYEENRRLAPPPVVVGRYDPRRHRPMEMDATAKTLSGTAVSPGVVTGKARVILHADDHEHVEAGEILVAPFTDPAWTPYFLPAAGVVMDLGGILSHGAIIAREYGIPAVVNVGPASRIIKTGQLLRVDGDRGVITVLDDTDPQ